MSDDITIEQLIGKNIKSKREQMGLSQAEFGTRVGDLLGTNWQPQTVSAAERGKRQFTAAELMVLAHVLDKSPESLFFSHDGAVKITEKLTLNLRAKMMVDRPQLSDEKLLEIFSDVHQVAGELVKMANDAQRTSSAIADVAHLARRLSEFHEPRRGNEPIIDGPNRTAVIAATVQRARDSYQSPRNSNA